MIGVTPKNFGVGLATTHGIIRKTAATTVHSDCSHYKDRSGYSIVMAFKPLAYSKIEY